VSTDEKDNVIAPEISRTHRRKSRRSTVSGPMVLLEKPGIDFMIRYSSYGGTNYRTNPTTPTKLLCSLATEYRELQDLRERVKKAEAAARNAHATPSQNSEARNRPRCAAFAGPSVARGIRKPRQ
jgi:hypothetical protein